MNKAMAIGMSMAMSIWFTMGVSSAQSPENADEDGCWRPNLICLVIKSEWKKSEFRSSGTNKCGGRIYARFCNEAPGLSLIGDCGASAIPAGHTKKWSTPEGLKPTGLTHWTWIGSNILSKDWVCAFKVIGWNDPPDYNRRVGEYEYKLFKEDAISQKPLALDRKKKILIQRGLISLKFDPGPTDGLFGPKTREAIHAWQKAKGYGEAGLTGRLTREQADALALVGERARRKKAEVKRKASETRIRAEEENKRKVKEARIRAEARRKAREKAKQTQGVTSQINRKCGKATAPIYAPKLNAKHCLHTWEESGKRHFRVTCDPQQTGKLPNIAIPFCYLDPGPERAHLKCGCRFARDFKSFVYYTGWRVVGVYGDMANIPLPDKGGLAWEACFEIKDGNRRLYPCTGWD